MKRVAGLYNILSLSAKQIDKNQKSTYIATFSFHKNKMYIIPSPRYHEEHARNGSRPQGQFARVIPDLTLPWTLMSSARPKIRRLKRVAGCCHPLDTHWLWEWFSHCNFNLEQNTLKLQEKKSRLGKKEVPDCLSSNEFQTTGNKKKKKKKSYKQLKIWTVHLPRDKLQTLMVVM